MSPSSEESVSGGAGCEQPGRRRRLPTFTAVTDAEGVARLRVPEGACSVSASKAGEYESEQAEDSVNVKDGKTARAEVALSQRLWRVHGVAIDANGRLVPGAIVCGDGWNVRGLHGSRACKPRCRDRPASRQS